MRVDLIYGKILTTLWPFQTNFTTAVSVQILKNNLAIWSQCTRFTKG